MNINHCLLVAALAAVTFSASAEKIGEIHIPTNGLSFHLDACDDSSLTYHEDGDGYVKGWKSSFGDIEFTNAGATNTLPFFEADGLGTGKGSLAFNLYRDGTCVQGSNYAHTWLTANKTAKMASVFMIIKMPYAGGDNPSRLICRDGNEGEGILVASHVLGIYNRSLVQTAYMWYNDTCYTTPQNTSTGDAYGYSDFSSSAVAVTIVNPNSQSAYLWCLGDSMHGATWPSYVPKRVGRMKLGEILAYDRAVTENERTWIINALYRKWWSSKGTAVVQWTKGTTPTASDWAYVTEETVEATEDTAVKQLTFLQGGGVKVSGAKLTMSKSVTAISCDDTPTLLSVSNGAISIASGATAQFDQVVIDGTMTKQGVGKLVLAGELSASDGSLAVENGTFDLAGQAMTLRNLTGHSLGLVTNTADTTSAITLVPGGEEASTLNARIQGDITVSRRGAAEVPLKASGSLSIPALDLGAGVTQTPTNELPVLAGCVIHLDAMRLDTLVTNDVGRVCKWLSLHNDGSYMFTTNGDHISYPVLMPCYDATVFGGRGGVRFGYDPVNQTYRDTFLVGNGNRSFCTYFMILREDSSKQYQGVIGTYSEDSWLFLNSGTGDYNFTWGTPISGNGDCWMNGQLLYSRLVTPYYTNATIAANIAGKGKGSNKIWGLFKAYDDPKYGHTQLLGVRRGNPWYGVYTSDIPSLGGARRYYTNQRHFTGYVGEMIVYDRMLSDDEFKRVQVYLMNKWGVEPRAAAPLGHEPLSGVSQLSLGDGATLDLQGMTQTVSRLSFAGASVVSNGVVNAATLNPVCAADGTLPVITILDLPVLLDGSLEFTGFGAGHVRHGKFLLAPKGVSGTFTSVTGTAADQINYRPRYVSVGRWGAMIILR